MKVLKQSSVILGHKRLSIIDTSANGNQPLADAQGNLWITYNGEIYNYLELKEELKIKGRVFKSETDTEVILQAYDEWGPELVSRLRGIFAFAIYCEATDTLFLARDSSGVKPLYFVDNGDIFGFASTPTALLEALGKSRQINDRALIGYLWFGNIPGTLSIYKGVQKLSPGTTLLLTQGRVRESRYSCLNGVPNKKINPEHLASHALESLIRDSLSINQRSDVPVAYFLSGGLDSTILCALAQESHAQSIPTFSIGFDSSNSDETPYALQASSIIGTNHLTTILNYEKAIGQLWDVACSHDEPFHINGLIPFTFLCKFVRECGYKVAIGGDGADELFGGYLWHSRWWEEGARSKLGRFGSIRNLLGIRRPSLAKYLDIFLHSSGGVRKEILSAMDASSPDEFLEAKLKAELLSSNDFIKYPLQIDQRCFLPDHCLTKVDRCSMYYGLEARVPFLDQNILSFLEKCSGDQINPNFQRKYLLKSIFKKQLVGIDLDRKKGFSSPLKEWWGNGLGKVAEYAISNSELIQSSELLTSLVQISKESLDIMSLVTLFSLALWSDCWMEDQKLSDLNFLLSL